MELIIAKDALSRMKKLLPMQHDFLLHLDDGQGIDFHEHVSCSVNLHFRLLEVKDHHMHPAYDVRIESTIGPVYVKSYSVMYLDPINYIRLGGYGEFQLAGKYAGNIDANLSVTLYE